MARFKTADVTPCSPVPGQPGFTYNQDGHPVDRWGRYGIANRGETKLIGRTRVTTYIGALSDTYNLHAWQQNYLAYGLACLDGWQEPVKEAFRKLDSENDEVRREARMELEQIREWAAREVGRDDKADWGTVVHALTEVIDNGHGDLLEPMKHGKLPDLYMPELAGLTENQQAILKANADLMYKDLLEYWKLVDGFMLEAAYIEPRTVNDELSLTGTPDRLWHAADPALMVGDLKTGSITFDVMKFSTQMAVYANSELYDLDTDMRTVVDIDRSNAYLIHLPAAKAEATLYSVDIEKGYDVCTKTIPEVKAIRRTKLTDVMRKMP